MQRSSCFRLRASTAPNVLIVLIASSFSCLTQDTGRIEPPLARFAGACLAARPRCRELKAPERIRTSLANSPFLAPRGTRSQVPTECLPRYSDRFTQCGGSIRRAERLNLIPLRLQGNVGRTRTRGCGWRPPKNVPRHDAPLRNAQTVSSRQDRCSSANCRLAEETTDATKRIAQLVRGGRLGPRPRVNRVGVSIFLSQRTRQRRGFPCCRPGRRSR